MLTLQDVRFQPKSKWQKKFCLFCPHKATLEAVLAEGIASSNVRCCDDELCKKYAAEIALIPFER